MGILASTLNLNDGTFHIYMTPIASMSQMRSQNTAEVSQSTCAQRHSVGNAEVQPQFGDVRGVWLFVM